jgi:hypothetical protein
MAEQNEKPKPIKDFRAGNIQAGIWRNEVQKDGQTFVRYSVRIQKQFRKDDGSYEDTSYFFPDELPKLLLLAQRAYEYIVLTESKDVSESAAV